jgi:chitin disaccharide deacetylase
MSIRLIVNADDFGYFDGVSAGIIEALGAGTVTATGVMANGPAFATWVPALLAHPQADIGVHLNATYGTPLTAGFPARLTRDGGMLPDKGALAVALLTGRLTVAAVAAEWRAQIEKCIASGLQIRFLNSHEHVHMFPGLYRVIVGLAREFKVPFVRYTQPEFDSAYGLSSFVRSLAIGGLSCVQSRLPQTPEFVGLAPSGHLDLAYVKKRCARLRSGRIYELMCHPGRHDPIAAAQPHLRHYHDWTGELECLLGESFREALARHDVQLARFRDLAL